MNTTFDKSKIEGFRLKKSNMNINFNTHIKLLILVFNANQVPFSILVQIVQRLKRSLLNASEF